MAAQHALVTLASLMKMLLRQLLTMVSSYLLTNPTFLFSKKKTNPICLIFSCSIILQKIKSHFLGTLFRHHCCCSPLWQQELWRTNSCIGSGQLSCVPSSSCGLCPCRHCKRSDWFFFFFWCHRHRINSCILSSQYVCICIRLILILRRSQLGKEEMEMMCTSRTYGHQTKKLQR